MSYFWFVLIFCVCFILVNFTVKSCAVNLSLNHKAAVCLEISPFCLKL